MYDAPPDYEIDQNDTCDRDARESIEKENSQCAG